MQGCKTGNWAHLIGTLTFVVSHRLPNTQITLHRDRDATRTPDGPIKTAMNSKHNFPAHANLFLRSILTSLGPTSYRLPLMLAYRHSSSQKSIVFHVWESLE